MLAIIPVVTSIVLAMAPIARQVVQSGPTGAIAVSRDGYVAMIDKEGALYLWHLPSRSLVRKISAALLDEDQGLVNPVLPTWDEATHEVMLVRASGILGVDLEGNRKVRAHDTTRLWPVGGTGKARWITKQYGEAEVRDASFALLGKLDASETVAAAGDGKTAVMANKRALVRFSLDPVARLQTIALPLPADDSLSTSRIASSRDGSIAAVCVKAGQGNQVVVVGGLSPDGKQPPAIRTLSFPDPIFGCQVAISDELGLVVVAAVDSMYGFEAATGVLRWRTALETNPDLAVTTDFAVSGRTALVTNHGIQLYDLARGDAIGEIGNGLAIPHDLWFLRGEALLTTRLDRSSIFGPAASNLATWSLQTGTLTARGQATWGDTFQIGEDGALAVVRRVSAPGNPEACYAFSRGTTADGAPLGTVVKAAWPPAPNQSKSLCVANQTQPMGFDLNNGAIVTYDRKRYVVESVRGKPVVLADTPQTPLELTFSPDGTWVMGSSMRGSWAHLDVWNTRTGAHGKLMASAKDPEAIVIGGDGPPRKGYRAHAISSDGTQLAVAGGDTVTVYRLADRRPVRTVVVPGPGSIAAVAFAPQGTLVLGTDDGRLVTSRGSTLASASSDGGAIQQIKVRADGRRLATVSDDGAIRIWDGRTGALAASLVEFADGESFASTPGGAYRGAREGAERVSWVFDGPTEGFSFERFAASFARPDIVTKRLLDGKTDVAIAVVRPPRVTVAAAPGKPTGPTVSVTAHVASAAKVEVLRAFVAGRPVSSQPVGAATADVTITVPLDQGANVVTLVAFDDGGRASNPTSFEINAPEVKSVRPEVWVIAAGVGWYPELPAEAQLEAPVNDARAIVDTFVGQTGAGKLYASSHVTLLEDEQVTPAALEQALGQLAAMKPTDVAIVFLAGHGVKLRGSQDMVFLTGSAKRDETTWATAGVGWTKIGKALQQAKGRVIVLLDACHAGNLTQEVVVPNSRLADDLVSGQRAGVLVFAASKGSQKSLEENAARNLVLDEEQKTLVKHKRTPKPRPAPVPAPTADPAVKTAPRERRGNGYFTGAFVGAIDAPSVDLNRNGLIEASEIIAQVRLRVMKASRGKQTPWVARRELFGDFVLATATK
jgi:hypothetical protein